MNLFCPKKPIERFQKRGTFLDRSARVPRRSAINAGTVRRIGQCQYQRCGPQLEVHLAALLQLQVDPLDEHICRQSWCATLHQQLEGFARK